jgi:DNA-binding NarL/FixJ family response regulator
MLLDGTRAALDTSPGIVVVGVADRGALALELVASQRPDVLVLDLHLPDVSGVEVARRVQSDFPRVAVVVLTGYDEPGYLRALLRLGVKGYLYKTASAGELVATVRAVADGRSVFASEATSALDADGEQLTVREHEVLRLLAAGLRNGEIAQQLGISGKTVEFHVGHLLEKLGARSRAEAIVKARRQHLLTDILSSP